MLDELIDMVETLQWSRRVLAGARVVWISG